MGTIAQALLPSPLCFPWQHIYFFRGSLKSTCYFLFPCYALPNSIRLARDVIISNVNREDCHLSCLFYTCYSPQILCITQEDLLLHVSFGPGYLNEMYL